MVAAVPDGADADVPQGYQYRSTTFSRASDLRFKNGRGADLIYAWTPRQNVAELRESLLFCTAARMSCTSKTMNLQSLRPS